jgi:hypothetical protein
MKKIIAAFVFLCVVVAGAFGQTMISTQNVRQYNSCFPENKQINGRLNMDYRYYESVCDDHYDRISAISGDITDIDTEEEFFLASYLCSGVVTSRPVQATQMLPKNRDNDLKVGAFMYQNLQIATFLRVSNASVYATLLNEFCTENRITRAEIEAFYRNNVRGLVSQVVDEEFNKVSFLLENYSTNSRFSYNAILTRNNQNGQYTLNYERPDRRQDGIKTLTAASLEALSSAMRNSGDFVPAAIDTVRAQAALIPAVVYGNWTPLGVNALDLVKETLTNFYLNPSQPTYSRVQEIYARYMDLRANYRDTLAPEAIESYLRSVQDLSPELLRRLQSDVRPETYLQFVRNTTDRRYNVFSTIYTTGR